MFTDGSTAKPLTDPRGHVHARDLGSAAKRHLLRCRRADLHGFAAREGRWFLGPSGRFHGQKCTHEKGTKLPNSVARPLSVGTVTHMNRLSTADRVRVVSCLVEGNSIRSTVRMTGIAKNTVAKLLVDIGCATHGMMERTLVNLPCKRVQCDEIWSFVYAKDKNIPAHLKNEVGVGSVWTWTALCADTKLVLAWFVAGRDAESARMFMEMVAGRLAGRVQLTTDGHGAYLDAVPHAFGDNIDYAQLVKLYGNEHAGEARYSPPTCTGCKKKRRIGKPEKKHISTSYVERQNLTMRMSMRRFTRLTNGFSKKLENHLHAVTLYFAHYNFCRVHQTLGVTPAMAAGVADHPWTLEELVGLLDSN